VVSAVRNQRGFTHAEIMIVVAIIGIIAAFGMPAMTRLLTTQAVRSASYDLFADLIYARGEAIARGTTVTMASASGSNWKDGWTIREDAGNTVLREQSARTSSITFTATQPTVTFDRNGRASTAGPMTFNIVPDATISSPQDSMKRCIRLDASGRPKSTEGACA
jgi:type IV fimbrial biogenesis protein FimT